MDCKALQQGHPPIFNRNPRVWYVCRVTSIQSLATRSRKASNLGSCPSKPIQNEFIKPTKGRPQYKFESFLISRFQPRSPFPRHKVLRYTITLLMSSVGSYTAHAERPERSRNAKAQARHRAKRKAYIEQVAIFTMSLLLGLTSSLHSWNKP